MPGEWLQEIEARAAGGGMYGGYRGPSQQSAMDFNMPGVPAPLAMAAQLFMQQFGRGTGMLPMQFMPMQNLADQYSARQYWAARNTALEAGAQADKQSIVDIQRGLYRSMGLPFGLQQERQARERANDIAPLLPIVSQMFPNLLDQLGGSRGSATVLAGRIHEGGRFQADPVTGLMGMTGTSAGEIARDMHEEFFGDKSKLAGWRGVTAGQAGELYTDLVRRGLMPRSIGTRDQAVQERLVAEGLPVETELRDMAEKNPELLKRLVRRVEGQQPGRNLANLPVDEQVRQLAETQGIAETAIREIRDSEPQRFEALVRQFDARRVANRLKGLSGAVSAMRDIFGDMGKPNAPMGELIEGLNQLTQGGLATMNPQQLEQTARLTQALAKQTGIGLDAMMGLTAQAAGRADQMGLDRSFAVQATQGAAAFGAAFGQVGVGDVPAWGRKDKEHLTLTDQQLRLGAARSPLANQLAATARLQAEVGFKEGSDAARLAAAIAAGQTEWTDAAGKAQSVEMNEARWRELMQQGGISRQAATSILQDRYTNQEYTARHRIGDTVRQMQGQIDLAPAIRDAYQRSVVGGLTAAGLDRDRALTVSRQVSSGIADALQNLTGEQRHDTEQRNAAMETAAREQLERAGVNVEQMLQQNPKLLREIAVSGWGNYEERIRRDPRYRHLETAQNSLDVTDKEVMKQQQRQMQQATVQGALRSSVAGLGRAGPLQRVMDALMQDQPPENVKELLGEVLSGVDPDEVLKRIETLKQDETGQLGNKERVAAILSGITEQVQQFRKAEQTPMSEDERLKQQQSITANLEALRTGGRAAAGRASALLQEAGLSGEDVAAVMSGQKAAPAHLRRTVSALRAAAAGDTGTAFADEGLQLNAKIGQAEVEDTVQQADKLGALLKKGFRRKGPDGKDSDDYLKAMRLAKGVAEDSRAATDVLLNDTASMEALGKGGLAVVKDVREKRRALGRMAAEKGVSVEELLVSGDQDARTLMEGVTAGMRDIATRQGRTADQKGKMTAEERKELTALQTKERRTDEEQARDLATLAADQFRVVGDRKEAAGKLEQAILGDASLSPEQREVRRVEAERALNARKRLDEIAKQHGLGDAQAVGKESKRWFGGRLSRAEAKEVQALMEDAGELMRIGEHAEGRGSRTAADALKEVVDRRTRSKQPEEKDEDLSGQKGTQRITGELRIIDERTAKLSGQSQHGSTPVKGN